MIGRGEMGGADDGRRTRRREENESGTKCKWIDVDMTSLCPTMMTYVSLQPAPAVARVLKEHNHEIIVSR